MTQTSSTLERPHERPEPTEVFRLLASAVEEHLHESGVDESSIRSIVAEELSKAILPRPIEVKLPDGQVNTLADRVHTAFESLLAICQEGHQNILLVGPAGSGKTTLAKNLAHALGLEFGFISLSAGVTETHLFGRVLPQSDGSWQYQPSRFVDIYERGGVFLLDELDAADANVMVAINAALANGVLANPNGRVHTRHANTYILAAANTWGRGGDLMYVGRNQLDASTLDRFVLSTLMVEYDEALEHDLARSGLPDEQAAELLQWVGNVRSAIRQNRLRRIASTRLVTGAILALRAGKSLDDVKARFLASWSSDEKAKVLA